MAVLAVGMAILFGIITDLCRLPSGAGQNR